MVWMWPQLYKYIRVGVGPCMTAFFRCWLFLLGCPTWCNFLCTSERRCIQVVIFSSCTHILFQLRVVDASWLGRKYFISNRNLRQSCPALRRVSTQTNIMSHGKCHPFDFLTRLQFPFMQIFPRWIRYEGKLSNHPLCVRSHHRHITQTQVPTGQDVGGLVLNENSTAFLLDPSLSFHK